jgi:ElaB/YqjD/DUF883 family membrane-anchored ribosome-binding protein
MDQKTTEPNRQRGENQGLGSSQFKEAARAASDQLARGRDAISGAAADAANAASSDLQALRNDLNNLRDTLTTFITRASGEATRSAREMASNVAGQVGDAASDLANRGANAASMATDRAKSVAGDLEAMARRNPLGALAGAVLLGVLIGTLARRN